MSHWDLPVGSQAVLAGRPFARLRWADCRLLDVERSGSSVQAVLIQRSADVHRIGCDVLIDGSDRGDLLPLVGAPFRLGWEPQVGIEEGLAATLEAFQGLDMDEWTPPTRYWQGPPLEA